MKKIFWVKCMLLLVPNFAAASIFCWGHSSSNSKVCTDANENYHLIITRMVYGSCEEVGAHGSNYEFTNNKTGEVVIVNDGGYDDTFGPSYTKFIKGYNNIVTTKDIEFLDDPNNPENVIVKIVYKNSRTSNIKLNCKG